jgi:hypothetical protein
VKRLSTRWGSLLLAALAGCASHQKKIDDYRAAYQGEGQIVERLLAPMGVEPAHGQVTISVTQGFVQKIVQASLHPNVLTVSVAEPGRVYRDDGKKLGIGYSNGVWLRQGTVLLHLDADQLVLDGDRLTMQTKLDGQGGINADLRFFGVSANRDVELSIHREAPIHLKLLAMGDGWMMKMVGAPLLVDVTVKLPAMKVAGMNLLDLKVKKTLEYDVEKIKPWALPLPAPRTVNVGNQPVQIALTHYQLGVHQGLLWIGADIGTDVPAAAPPSPNPTPAPATAPAPAPAPAPAK